MIKIILIILAAIAICYYLSNKTKQAKVTPVKRQINSHREPPYYPRRELKRKPKYDAEAEKIKAILLSLYTPKEDFTIVLNRKFQPKTRAGIYRVSFRQIVVYCRWGTILETSIHEYAHHIFETEQRTERKTKCHGKGFKQILAMLGNRYKEVYGRTLYLS